jgi:hypothetical protein
MRGSIQFYQFYLPHGLAPHREVRMWMGMMNFVNFSREFG